MNTDQQLPAEDEHDRQLARAGHHVVIACSGSKLTRRAPALMLYDGPLFKSARRWALSVTPAWRIWVLSALHGLVRAADVLEPYDRRAHDSAELAELLRRSPGLASLQLAPIVFVIGGKMYREAVEQVLPHAISLPHARVAKGREHRGIGAQRGWFAAHEGEVP